VIVRKSRELPLRAQEDVVRVRQATRELAIEAGFGLVDQTKVVTAASELARNTVLHGLGGIATIELLDDISRTGLRLVFQDEGPGIPDVDLAMRDGYTTGNGLGLGMGGSRRLLSTLEVRSEVGRGTRVTAVKWK
jgi:serine/threonine-protein kinase RsbT